EREVTADEVNAAFKAAADGPLKDVLRYAADPIVSSAIVGTAPSCTFDSSLTMSCGSTVKVIGWDDNEWGYSNRLVDVVKLVGAGLYPGAPRREAPARAGRRLRDNWE